MKVIAVLSQKGGSGKSTISINIARCLQLKGYNVAFNWYRSASIRARMERLGRWWGFPVYGCDKGFSDKEIKQLEKVADFVVIDGAPRIEKSMSDSIRLADYILIPLKPSQLDIWACQDSIELVQARMMVDDKLKPD